MVVGAIAFVFGLFLPLWTMMLIGRDPGDLAGGILTIWAGGPIGLLLGIATGVVSFNKLRILTN